MHHAVLQNTTRLTYNIKRHQQLYSKDKLLAHPLEKRGPYFSYPQDIEQQLQQSIREALAPYSKQEQLFQCHMPMQDSSAKA